MKGRKSLLLASLSGIMCLSAQETNKIDTINISKPAVSHKFKVSLQVSKKDLEKSSGGNLANTLKNIAGITLLQSGANISKPVIQGLSNQRIMVLNNGVKIESQQWGHDHAPEIDPFLAQNIEVIKGAEAVKYGANAMGGVVLLKSEKLPYFGQNIGGKIQLIGESNSWKGAGNLMLQGNYHEDNVFAWRVQSSVKRAGDYKTADYFVENTGVKELNYSINVGYQMPKEKTEFFYSYFSTKLGVYSGSRIGNREDLDLRILSGRPIEKGGFSYRIGLPNQDVKHHLAKINLESNRDFGKLNATYSFQKNHRQEYDSRRGAFADKPTLDVEMMTHTASLDFQKQLQYFKNYLGLSLSHQRNQNVPGTGVNSILPTFLTTNFGAYISADYEKNSWLLNAGFRYDYKNFLAVGYNRFGKFYTKDRAFQNFSYSFGIGKSFGKHFSLSSNIGTAWRPPEAIELFSDGVHHGSAFYLYGDSNLNLEKALKWSTKLNFKRDKLSISADFFLQKIKGFIYEMPTDEYRTEWAGEFRVFRYKQSDAFFRGVDLDVKYKAFDWLDYRAKASLIHASNLTENYYFPSISPENVLHRLDFKLPLKNAYVSLEHYWVNKQWRFSEETDLLPDSPSAYHLLNISLGADLVKNMNFIFEVNNATNQLYKDYTDKFRYFAHGMGRNFQIRINYNF
ncbi:MAG: TonB-dependent receptor [Flavobacteriaceae bacterium]|nr:TonB-dependent receptor [Flavobacteriaceae bacterium]